ncbi:MAG TPA: acylphosphatase [Patescibacteria group bacterium]|nr:acylphosphatase [Patescibacteria group bacterium]
MPQKSYQCQITGRVQGVFFRSYLKKHADNLHLAGWAKNEPSGSVLLEVQGEGDAVDEFLKLVKIGSENAKITKVKVRKIPNQTNLKEFIIKII